MWMKLEEMEPTHCGGQLLRAGFKVLMSRSASVPPSLPEACCLLSHLEAMVVKYS